MRSDAISVALTGRELLVYQFSRRQRELMMNNVK
jgi:hypothetical protein